MFLLVPLSSGSLNSLGSPGPRVSGTAPGLYPGCAEAEPLDPGPQSLFLTRAFGSFKKKSSDKLGKHYVTV